MDQRASFMETLFSLQNKVAIVTGATGVLGGTMARGLARAGARVGVLGRREERAQELAEKIINGGGDALALSADVLERDQRECARRAALERWGRIDILVNAAGGNIPAATVEVGSRIFDLPVEAFREVLDLNLLGTLLPIQVFGEAMTAAAKPEEAGGCVVNISSMAAQKPLTKVAGYSAAKAAVENFTRWLAVEFARNEYGAAIRVNAIAPGFFLGEQNRAMFLNEDGSLTERGEVSKVSPCEIILYRSPLRGRVARAPLQAQRIRYAC